MLFSSVFALISNSAEKECMGRVNGISQSLVALFRAIGPPTAGQLFAWSVAETSAQFPRNVFFNYALQLGAFALIFLLSLGLSHDLNHPRDELALVRSGGATSGEETEMTQIEATDTESET